MPNRRYNKQVANQMKAGGRVKRKGGGMGGRTGEMMYSRGYGEGMKSKSFFPNPTYLPAIIFFLRF